MAKKNELQKDLNEPQETVIQKTTQDIFDETTQSLMNEFSELLNKYKCNNIVTIIKHNESDNPIIVVNDNKYGVGIILAEILRDIKSEIYKELNTEPNQRLNLS